MQHHIADEYFGHTRTGPASGAIPVYRAMMLDNCGLWAPRQRPGDRPRNQRYLERFDRQRERLAGLAAARRLTDQQELPKL